ncbi:MAG: KTSC domain-containing protein [Planctomycetota bacterium]|nr:KTSC domain-containing protein [Planctomycetota bacterium]
MTLVPADSTMLAAVGFDRSSGELEAVFVDGAVWRYRDVPENVYKQLPASDSKGSYMRSCIVDQYPDYRIRRRS